MKILRPRGQPTQNGRARAKHAGTLKRDFIAINDEADLDVQDFSENGHEVAGLQQPIDISDDEAVAEIVDQFVVQNVYTQVVNGAPVTMMTV